MAQLAVIVALQQVYMNLYYNADWPIQNPSTVQIKKPP